MRIMEVGQVVEFTFPADIEGRKLFKQFASKDRIIFDKKYFSVNIDCCLMEGQLTLKRMI